MPADRPVGSVILGGAALSLVPLLGQPNPGLVGFIAHTTGMLAGYGAAVMLVLTSRAPGLERRLGTGALIRWHALGGRVIVVLILAHAVGATLAWLQIGGGLPRLVSMPGMLAAIVSVVLFLVVALSVVPWLRRRLSYERWHAVHLLTYVAIALGFIHQLAGPDLAGNRVAQVAWAQLYCLAFFLSLRYRFVEPLRQARRHRLVVDRVQRESHDTVSIWLRGRHLSELAARPGQFFRWRFLTAQTWMSAHPFSLSALPEGDRLRITVKALGDGSRRLHELESGVRVLAEGPYGRAESGWRPTLLIAGGVGITPLRALFEAHAVDGLPTTLLYRASSRSDVLFRSELDELAARHHARVIYVLGPSGDPANALTPAALTALLPDLLVHDVFVCASPRLSAAVRESLRAAGLPARQLHDESLSF